MITKIMNLFGKSKKHDKKLDCGFVEIPSLCQCMSWYTVTTVPDINKVEDFKTVEEADKYIKLYRDDVLQMSNMNGSKFKHPNSNEVQNFYKEIDKKFGTDYSKNITLCHTR